VRRKIEATKNKFQGRFTSTSFAEKIKHGLVGTPEECASKLETLKEMGVDVVFLQPLDSPDLDSIRQLPKSFLAPTRSR
jgi:alkanesulfonate monooxygenase SsuD/methylene tetrahydromethanopterin reductase-like flavin-dependent oxidoreductase (luciferase family)